MKKYPQEYPLEVLQKSSANPLHNPRGLVGRTMLIMLRAEKCKTARRTKKREIHHGSTRAVEKA